MAETRLEELTRGQLLRLANLAAELAAEATEPTRTISTTQTGQSKDPAVRRLAAMAITEMHTAKKSGGKGLSFDEIGTILGISRQRAYQLFHELTGETDGKGG